MRGFIYVLDNKFLVGAGGVPLLKIGGTARSAYERSRELSAATGVPGTFTVVFEAATSNWQHLEALVHRRLRAYRRAGEFFELPLADVVACIENIQRQLAHLRERQVDYQDLTVGSATATGVCFVERPERPGGYDVYCEGAAVGSLFINDTSATYMFLPEILLAEVFALPGPGNAYVLKAVTREAKKRAAWLAPILRAFTLPQLLPGRTERMQIVVVNGLPVAELEQTTARRGLFRKRSEMVYDWRPLPFSKEAKLAQDFAARVTLAPSRFTEAPMFVAPPFEPILAAVTRHLKLSIFVSVSMSTQRWRCSVDVMAYSISLEESAPQ